MGKIKLTKGELKYQRDCLQQYQRYLPILYLKKQQLQIEILHQINLLKNKEKEFNLKKKTVSDWIELVIEEMDLIKNQLLFKIFINKRNIAGIDIPVFGGIEFSLFEYDLFTTPLWVDKTIEALVDLITIREEIAVIEEGIEILQKELRITTQRVNLFEKIKIPQTKEAIRIIKIYLGDQMANAVCIGKIAKKKIQIGQEAGALI